MASHGWNSRWTTSFKKSATTLTIDSGWLIVIWFLSTIYYRDNYNQRFKEVDRSHYQPWLVVDSRQWWHPMVSCNASEHIMNPLGQWCRCTSHCLQFGSSWGKRGFVNLEVPETIKQHIWVFNLCWRLGCNSEAPPPWLIFVTFLLFVSHSRHILWFHKYIHAHIDINIHRYTHLNMHHIHAPDLPLIVKIFWSMP